MLKKNAICSKEIDALYAYDGKDLGADCSGEGTIFKVWSPLADKIELHLYRDGESESFQDLELLPDVRGTWQLKLAENLHGVYYDYTVWIDGTGTRTADPYAVACSCNGQRSMVVNLRLTDPEGFAQDKPPARGTEQVIYELHVKDFSYDRDSGIPEEYRGKFKAFTITGTNSEYPTCIEYLKRLGITHVHLLPIFDYGFVDEAGEEKQYNWGYDPMNYNVPEGSYATDPYDGTVRIRECKEMVQVLHQNGIRVIMDVVYNHTYRSDSWLERMVPGYYYRHWEDGSLSNGSACGNDIAAGRAMVDNYIVDSILFWAREYHIDGFRFDLMGLLTVELMNRIRKTLNEEFGEGEKLIYGEPWRAMDSPMEEGDIAPLKDNILHLDDGISIFSDDTRDVIKGDVFYGEAPGFVNGGRNLEKRVLRAVTGWRRKEGHGKAAWPEGGFATRSCSQVINYVSAHDNFTLWDKLVLSMHGGNGYNNEYRKEKGPASEAAAFRIKHPDVLEANKLAAFIYFTCQGYPFLQAGEEFGRTKYGDSNSFRSHPEINMLRWHQTVEFHELVSYYRGLIRLRKRLPGLYDKSAQAAGRISEETVHGEGLVSFLVDNRGEGEPQTGEDSGICCNLKQLFILYNAGKEAASVKLPMGDWKVLADKEETDCFKNAVVSEDGHIQVAAVSGLMLGLAG